MVLSVLTIIIIDIYFGYPETFNTDIISLSSIGEKIMFTITIEYCRV